MIFADGPATRPAAPQPGRLTAAAVTGVGVTAVAVAALLSPAVVESGPDLCPFRRMTGLPCPGCGLTRSWVALAHGDVSSAFSFNLFGPVFLAVTVLATLGAVWALVRGGTAMARLTRMLRHPVAFGIVAVWFGYGLVRMADAAAGWGIFPAITG